MTTEQSSDEKRVDKLDKWFGWGAFALSVLGIIIIVLFVGQIMYQGQTILNGKPILWDETSKAGDFIGGVVGSLWSFAGILLLVQALRIQRKEFEAQREELRLQRREFELQRNEIKQQRQEFTAQRITDIIYQQLAIIHDKGQRLKFHTDGTSDSNYREGMPSLRHFKYEYDKYSVMPISHKPRQASQQRVVNEFLARHSGFIGNIYTQDFLKTVRISIEMCQMLIEDEYAESDLFHSNEKQILYSLLYHNFSLELILSIIETCSSDTNLGKYIRQDRSSEPILATLQSLKSKIDLVRSKINDEM